MKAALPLVLLRLTFKAFGTVYDWDGCTGWVLALIWLGLARLVMIYKLHR